MASITIGGKTYVGNNIQIRNNVVTIDGKTTECGHPYNISVSGDVNKIEVDSCNTLTVSGVAQTVSTMSGDITCNGDIGGKVKTMSGDVTARNIVGDVETMSGDVDRAFA
jgi:hypothetical protein